MNSIKLDEGSFWDWMSISASASWPQGEIFRPQSNSNYVHLLSTMMEDHWHSIAQVRHAGGSPKSARTLDLLSRHIPRKYFLELQFCLAAYSSVFATLFPSMLSHLDNLCYIEWLLHMEPDDEKYRDHLVHMFRVAFVCDRLMQLQVIHQNAIAFQFSSTHFLKWCEEKLGIDPSGWDSPRKERLLCAAIYLSAIFHDVGYGYYFLNQYRQRLVGVLPVLTHAEATADLHHRDMANIRNSLAAKFVAKYHHAFQENESPANEEVILSGFFRDNLGINHSVASGVFLADLAGNLYDRHAIGDELYVAFHLAAEAAMLHDMTKDDKWLHFSTLTCGRFLDCKKQKEVPIATLLWLADNIELGRRPGFFKIVKDKRCTFVMEDEKKNRPRPRIEYDESKKCLIIEPSDLIVKKDFIFDSEKKCYVLFDIPMNKLDPTS
ncbi:MAG: hypothetical protein ACE144_17030 [Thermodesulfobacteriota bacterium]